jgi:hypothetical protein
MDSRIRKLALVPSLVFGAWSTARGQSVLALPGPQPLSLPAWLAPFPDAHGRMGKSTWSEVTSTYTSSGSTAAVISHYEREMRDAGITFRTNASGKRASIEASTAKTSCSIHISESTGVVMVEVQYALRPDPAPVPQTSETHSDAGAKTSFQEAFDDTFKSSCRQSAMRSGHVSQSVADSYCDCALSVYHETSSMTRAAQTCSQRVKR